MIAQSNLDTPGWFGWAFLFPSQKSTGRHLGGDSRRFVSEGRIREDNFQMTGNSGDEGSETMAGMAMDSDFRENRWEKYQRLKRWLE